MDEQPTEGTPNLPPTPGMPIAPMGQPTTTNGIAIAGLVCGILSIILFFTIVPPFILGLLGVVFGLVGMSKAANGAPNKGVAIAGLITGLVGIAIAIAFIALFVTTSVELINDFSISPSPFG